MAVLPPIIRDSLFGRLFLRKHFGVHRIFGLCYLIQWTAAMYLYWTDFRRLESSFLVWTLPLSGMTQTFIAMMTFTFLPHHETGQGYFTSKRAMSYDFITENLFFATILAFHWFYMVQRLHDNVVSKILPLEYLFVFFPYQFRLLFPKTRLGNSMDAYKDSRDINKEFYRYASMVTKIFYIWAKHFIGFFLNYCRFLNRITPGQMYHMYFLMIMSCAATTISIFLHTLKFKGYIGPRTSFYFYFASYTSTFYSFIWISEIFTDNFDLLVLAFVGLVINFAPGGCQFAYQVFVCALLTWVRMGGNPAEFAAETISPYVSQNVSDGFDHFSSSVLSLVGIQSGAQTVY